MRHYVIRILNRWVEISLPKLYWTKSVDHQGETPVGCKITCAIILIWKNEVMPRLKIRKSSCVFDKRGIGICLRICCGHRVIIPPL